MNKYIQKVEEYKLKTLGKALETLKSEYKEALDFYRDSGYDRYYKKMCRREVQIEEIEKYMEGGLRKETELQADSYKELLLLREAIKNIKSKVFYLSKGMPMCADLINLQDMLKDFRY